MTASVASAGVSRSIGTRSPALVAFLALVIVQGVHEIEHVVQVVQRSALGMPNGNGVLGSVADIEPVHLAYNTTYLALLVTVYVLLGLHREGLHPYGRLVAGLLTFALAFQMWHELEHVFKVVQYVALGTNGTGGILGQGPGALAPLLPIPLLHLAYNTIAYLPALAAFVLLHRKGPGGGPSPHARQPRWTSGLVGGEVGLVPERERDVVETFEQPPAGVILERERR